MLPGKEAHGPRDECAEPGGEQGVEEDGRQRAAEESGQLGRRGQVVGQSRPEPLVANPDQEEPRIHSEDPDHAVECPEDGARGGTDEQGSGKSPGGGLIVLAHGRDRSPRLPARGTPMPSPPRR